MTEPIDVDALLGELTAEEKASLASGQGFWWTRAVPRLGIPSIMVSDGPHGLRKQDRRNDHLGLGDSTPATCFPTASALASSWDAELLRAVGDAIGEEARAQGVSVVLGPGINIKRSPLCGRNFEYLSEDPHLSGVLGVALVEGIQGRGVGTSLKHFAVNNQEADRLRVSADVEERPLREVYLAAFEHVVRTAQPWTVMCSYNRINGVYASQDPWLLTEVLRHEWGFEGLVVSDWGAVDDPVAAVAAGLDLEMPSTGGASAARLVAAMAAGELDPAALDAAVGRVLGLVARAGAAGHPDADVTFDVDAHHALARRAAADCAVLLRNERGALPLHLAAGRLAVIGELARTPRFQGAGSSKVNPTRVDDALTALREGVPREVEVDFAPGYGVDDPRADHGSLREEAVAVARAADAVVVFLGLPPSYESEGYDRDHIDLPPEQVELLAAVADVTADVVVVLANGSVVAVDAWIDRTAAVLEAWLGGQAGGGAVADVLLGAVNPSGRLAETMPRRLADTPAHLNFPGEDRHVRYGEGLFVGYRHHDAVGREVSFPFGHGLSYTTFEHADLDVRVLPAGADRDAGWRGPDRLEVSVAVTNTGAVAGQEVVQVYVGDPEASVTRPVRELKGFAKVRLEPGETATATVVLAERDLSYWSTRAGGWVFEPGEFEVAVGASSRDLRQRAVVHVDGPPLALPLDRESTLAEWLEHPVGHEVVLAALRRAPGGDLSGLVDDPERLRMLGSFPLKRLVGMLGMGEGAPVVDGLLAEVVG
ncbi:MAG: glycoside hydrolase family 3 C-terminal domain-containing protein [Actinobacteria bacterium]|nr:glycoside hydrolase family 3 C-terminal domain-containing protein [Actinomycetota bacterium]